MNQSKKRAVVLLLLVGGIGWYITQGGSSQEQPAQPGKPSSTGPKTSAPVTKDGDFFTTDELKPIACWVLAKPSLLDSIARRGCRTESGRNTLKDNEVKDYFRKLLPEEVKCGAELGGESLENFNPVDPNDIDANPEGAELLCAELVKLMGGYGDLISKNLGEDVYKQMSTAVDAFRKKVELVSVAVKNRTKATVYLDDGSNHKVGPGQTREGLSLRMGQICAASRPEGWSVEIQPRKGETQNVDFGYCKTDQVTASDDGTFQVRFRLLRNLREATAWQTVDGKWSNTQKKTDLFEIIIEKK